MKDKILAGDNIYFFKMFRFMKPYWLRYALSQFMYSAQGFLFPFFISIFAANITAAIVARDADAVTNAGITLGVMILGFLLLLLIGIYVNIIVIERAALDLKKELFRKFMKTGIESASHSGEGIATINTESDTALQVYQNPLMEFMSNIISIVGATIVVFAIDWRLGFSAIFIGVVSFFMQNRFTKPLAQIGKDRLLVNAEGLKVVSNLFSGAMTIRAYNIQKQTFFTFDKENNKLKLLDVRRGIIEMWQNLFGTITGWMTLVSVFGFGGWLAATGRLEFHMVAAVFLMSSTLTSSIGAIGRAYANLQPPLAGAKKIFAVLDRKEFVSKRVLADKKIDLNIPLKLENFSFKYLDNDKNVLSNINLTIEKNKMVALVGKSGSGKSTLLRVILGFYERDDMGLSFGGVNFNECTIKDWRQNFSYVDQSCKLFDISVRENIAQGLGSKATEEEIAAAAKRAAAHDFILELENGYDAPCGEKGSTLSGGQRQRIAIARALVKGAPVLVFDEATAALDMDSEKYIMETIEDLRSDHTIIITTHTLENVKAADLIVVLDDGFIIETGNHEELMLKKGLYYELATK